MTIEHIPATRPKAVEKAPPKPRNRAGRKSDIERDQYARERLEAAHALKQTEARLAREAEFDENRMQPMSADTKGVNWAALVGIAIIGLGGFGIGFGAIYEVAAWTGYAPWQIALFPILFDVGIVVFTLLAFVRTEKGVKAWPAYLLAESLTLVSAVVQVTHVLVVSEREGPELVVACVMAAMPSLLLSACSYLAGRTIFRRVESAA